MREASCQVKAAAVIRVEMAERAWKAIMGKLRVAEAVAARAWAEAERLKQAPECGARTCAGWFISGGV